MNPASAGGGPGGPAAAPRRLRIAFVGRRFGARFGGAEAYGEHLLARLRERHDIHVFCQEWDSPLPLPHTVVPRNRLLPRWLNLLDFGRRCAKLVRDFDIVHSHENLWLGDIEVVHVIPVRYSRLYARDGLARRLQTFTSPRWLTYLALEARRLRERPGRTVVAASELIAGQVRRAYARTAPLTVITPGVDLPARSREPGRARVELGLDPGHVYLLLLANDPPRKGLAAALDALGRLPARVHLMVVGGDEAIAARVRRQAEAAGLASRVQVWRGRREVGVFYEAADICLFATLGDAFGMVPLEAMAHGLPVILSGPAHCGFSRHLATGRDALVLADPRDAGEIAGAVGRLLQEPALRARLVRHGGEVARRFDWASIARQFEQVYMASVSAAAPLDEGVEGNVQDVVASRH